MPKRVRLPDGQIGVFGDDESNEQIRAKISKKYPAAYPEPGALPAVGRAARGAGRALAGHVADAASLGSIPGAGALFPPAKGLSLLAREPHVRAGLDKVEEFANAPTPSTSESLGWWGVQGLEALLPPGGKLPLELGAKGLKYGAGLVKEGIKKGLGESARQLSTQTGKEVGEQAVKKPRLRIKASGDVKEITPEGEERTVRLWTKRRMEKLGQRARGEPTSSTAPPTQEGVHEEYQQLLDRIGDHGVHHVAKYFANAMGIPTWTAHMIMMRGPRSVMDRGLVAGTLGAGRTLSGEAQNERRNRPPENNPPALPQNLGGPQ